MTEGQGKDAGDLRVGQTVEADVVKAVYRGRGLARVGGRVVFVPRAHAGDRVRARVREVRPGWAEAVLEEVLTPAPGRRPSPCPYVPRCGGCAYQDLEYEDQLRAKEGILRESLARAGAPWEGPIVVHPSPELGWRLRASLHFASDGEQLRLGLRQEGTRRVVDVERCLQLSEGMNESLVGLRRALDGLGRRARKLEGVDLLESPEGRARVAAVSTALGAHQAPDLARAARAVPGLTGFGVVAGRRLHWLHGSPFVEIPVLSLALRVHVGSFFQANRYLVEPLARTVVELLSGPGRVLDLYAGVGLFALPLAARDGGEVVAVERASRAARDATANVRRHRLGGVRVVQQDVGRPWPRSPASRESGWSSTLRGRAWRRVSRGRWRSAGPRWWCTCRATRPPWAGTSPASPDTGTDPTRCRSSTSFPTPPTSRPWSGSAPPERL